MTNSTGITVKREKWTDSSTASVQVTLPDQCPSHAEVGVYSQGVAVWTQSDGGY